MKNLVTLAVLFTLSIVVHSQVDVYSGSTNFLVHVIFNGEFLCGASVISNHNALTLYRKPFKATCYFFLNLMVPTALKIHHIEFDRDNPNPEKFAVIMVREDIFAMSNCGPPIDLPVEVNRDELKSSNIPAYAIGWQGPAESLIVKTYTIPSTGFTHRDVSTRINDKINFKKYVGGALIKNNILIGIAHLFPLIEETQTYVLYLNVIDRYDEISKLLEKVESYGK